jgi:hypothetical protein
MLFLWNLLSYLFHAECLRSRDSSVGIEARLRDGRLRHWASIPDRGKRFFLLFLLRMLFLWNLFSILFRSEYISGAGITQSVETRLQAGWPRDRGSIPGRGKRLSLLHTMQTGSGAYRASYTVGTRGFPAGEAHHSLPCNSEALSLRPHPFTLRSV